MSGTPAVVKYSINAKLTYSVAGVASPAWLPLDIVKDVTLTMDKSEFDVTTRANAGFKATAGAMIDASIEFEMIWDPTNAGFQALQTAFITNAAIGISCLDGTSGNGLVADCAVLSFTREEPLEEGLKAKIKIKPTYSATAPHYATGGA